MHLSQVLRGITFQNPLISAAGKWAWTADQCRQIADAGAGGITTKSFSTLVRSGHPEQTVLHTDHYTLNAVGLPSDGFEPVQADLGPFIQDRPCPVIVSIFGDTIERFAEAASTFAMLGADALELNISCPNVADDHGRPFSYLPATAKAAVQAARETVGDLTLFVKLSPNTPDLTAVALACIDGGCDGLTLVNTLGPGMAIDVHTRKAVLSNKAGGVSGAAIKPVAVRCVADIYKATDGRYPIIGVGGVERGIDAIELMMAGASLVGMGTTVLQEGYGAFGRVVHEMQLWCEEEGVKDIQEIIGAVHHV